MLQKNLKRGTTWSCLKNRWSRTSKTRRSPTSYVRRRTSVISIYQCISHRNANRFDEVWDVDNLSQLEHADVVCNELRVVAFVHNFWLNVYVNWSLAVGSYVVSSKSHERQTIDHTMGCWNNVLLSDESSTTKEAKWRRSITKRSLRRKFKWKSSFLIISWFSYQPRILK